MHNKFILKEELKLFSTGFIQVLFVAINTVFLSREYYIGVFIFPWCSIRFINWFIYFNNNNKNNTMSILATIFKFLVSTVKTIIVKVTTTSSSTKIHIEDVSGSIINITTETKQKQ